MIIRDNLETLSYFLHTILFPIPTYPNGVIFYNPSKETFLFTGNETQNHFFNILLMLTVPTPHPSLPFFGHRQS